jgi:flagellum-specific ATP synthase
VVVERQVEQFELCSVERAELGARSEKERDVGAYQRGANPLVDAAVDHEVEINSFLQQRMSEQSTTADAWAQLERLVTTLGGS